MAEGSGFSSLASPPATPGYPQNPLPIIYEGFQGLNTKASQQGIQDQEMFVCDGLMPLGPDNLRCLRGLGDPIFTVPGGADPASGYLYFASNPANGSTITLNGRVITFVTGGGGYPNNTSNYQIDILGTTGATIENLVEALTASATYLADALLNVANYSHAGGTTTDYFYINYNIAGVVGNAYTLAASAATRSGATLAGGGLTIVNYSFNNIGDTPICVVCLDDGSLIQVNLDTLAVTYMSKAFATGSIFFSANPSPGDTITLDGSVWTFVASGATGNETNIAPSLSGTLALLTGITAVNLNTTTDPNISLALYSVNGGNDTLLIQYKTIGTAGNSFTLAASAATPSGGTLTGGSAGGGIITSFPPAYSQWAGAYVIIVAPQTNGYFLWDGVNLYTSGTLSPEVVITNSGLNYATPPTITVNGGSGSGATFTGVVENGSLVGITVDNPGKGYLIGDLPILTITGGGSDDSASATAVISTDSGVASVNITNGGAGYSQLVNVTPSSGGSPSIDATFSVVGSNGVITQVIVQNPGLGYSSAPTLTVTDLATGAVGTGAVISAVMQAGQIGSVTVDSGGTGYVTPPTMTIVGDGIGAILQANLSADVVNTITVISAGTGYTKAAIEFSGGNNSASAEVTLMPFGVQGNTVETFQSRVWVGNGRNGTLSAPGSPSDFSSADGATVFQSTDSFLRFSYTKFIQSNGFIYLIADSSMNYGSGVNTSGNPVITTFSNLNVDPQKGTPWPATAQVFGRDIVFANPVGVHVSYGGAVTKVSDALDGIYTSVPPENWPEGFTPSAAVMNIFGIQVYVLAMPMIIKEISPDAAVYCLMWDGKKWWTSQQEDLVNPFFASQDFNSQLTAYCSANNTTIRPMFSALSENFERTLISKLWSHPGVFLTKMQREIFCVVNVNVVNVAAKATGEIDFTVNPSVGDQIILNGVAFTFVATPGGWPNVANNYEINIAGGGLGGTLAFLFQALTTGLTYLADPSLNVASYTDGLSNNLVVTYKTTGAQGNSYTLGVVAPGMNPPVASGHTLTGGTAGPQIMVTTITEDGLGAESTVDITKSGPVVFGPLPSADAGRLIGVRVRTAMSDIQINQIAMIPNLQQSNV